MNCIAFFDPHAQSNAGKIRGVVEFHSCSSNHQTLVRFKLSGFPPNTIRGVHVHEEGDLTQGCASACAHYNPTNQLHGSIQLFGSSRHMGDLCNNITSDEKGNVNFEYFDDLIDLDGPYSILGRMVVIHAQKDDLGEYRSQTDKRGIGSGSSGNAGARIACAVIGRTNRDLH